MRYTLLIMLSCCLLACSQTNSRVRLAADNFYEGNYTRSLGYLQRPAQQGDSDAQYALGYMLYYGKGITENKTEAVKWLQLAATQGHSKAQQALKRIHQAEQRYA